MKHSWLILLLFAGLLLTGCAREGSLRDHLPEQPSPTEPIVTTAPPAAPQETPDPTLPQPEGFWIAERYAFDGTSGDPREAGMEVQLSFHPGEDGLLLADVSILFQEDPARSAQLTDMPAVPEGEGVWRLDNTGQPPAVLHSLWEEFLVGFTPEGSVYLQVNAELSAEPWMYGIRYYFRPAPDPENLCPLTIRYGEEQWFSPGGTPAGTVAAQIDPAEEGGIPVLLCPLGLLTDVEVVSLEYGEDLSQPRSEVLLAVGPLTEASPLLLRLAFPGSLPSRGIRFSENGNERTFAIAISGRDGSLILTEVNPTSTIS